MTQCDDEENRRGWGASEGSESRAEGPERCDEYGKDLSWGDEYEKDLSFAFPHPHGPLDSAPSW